MSDVTLIHGDCLQVMPTLPAQSVAMAFVDAPYAVSKTEVTRNVWDKPFDIMAFKQAILPTLASTQLMVFSATARFAANLITAMPKLYSYDLVWQKSRLTGFFRARSAPMRGHEWLLVFYAKTPTYNPQLIESKSYTDRRTIKPNQNGANFRHGSAAILSKANRTSRYPSSVVAIKSEHNLNNIHPTQKPVALLEWLIKTYTNSGDTILDPVAGSGTTAIAALRTGRKAICIEKDPVYFAAMTKRVADEQAQLSCC